MDKTNGHTYILKINLNDILQNDMHNIIQQSINDITNTNNSTNNNIIYMNKNEYSNYIFDNSGTIINKYKTSDICSICCSNLKNTHKLFKLDICNHLFHYKCIKKCFKEASKQNFIHKCPLCRSSNEVIYEI